MAETIGLAIIAALPFAVPTTAAATIGAVAITAATTLASFALNALNAPKPRNETQQSVLNQAIGPRIGVYGRTIVGGSRALFETREGGLLQAIVVAAHEIDGFEKFLIGDRYAVVTESPANNFTVKDYPQENKIGYQVFFGTEDQQVSDFLQSRFGVGPNPIWSTAHRLRGLAYAVVLFIPVKKEEQTVVYPQSYATPLRFLIRGKKVWNPANAAMNPDDPTTWAWSENAADCILDYLRSRDGLRFQRARIDIDSFKAMRALCAETVTRKDGSTEPRYRIGGTYAFNEAPKDVLARMCAACDGQLVRGPSGLIGIRGGRYVAPLVNIPTAQIVTSSLTQGNDRLDAYNRLSVSYSDPEAYYQPTQLQAREDLTSQARIGVVDETVDLVMVPSWTQAARLAKIKFAKDNPAWKGTLGTTLAALNALGEETVGITYDPLGDDDVGPLMDTVANVNAFGLRADMTGCDLQFSSISAAAYAWNPATEEPPRPALPGYVAPVNDVAAPTGATVNPSRRNVAGGSTAVWGVLSWNAATRADAQPQAQYRLVGSGESGWQPMTLRSDGQSAEAGPLTDGQTYDFRVRFVAGSTPSNWTMPVQLQATADNVSPPTPSYLSLAGPDANGVTTHTARMPNAANARSIRLARARGFGKGFADSVQVDQEAGAPNATLTLTDTIDLGFFSYYIQALNGSGVASGPSGARQSGRYLQAGNLLVAPYDLTNTAWIKSNITATSSGTGPDGGGSTSLLETTANAGHVVDQAVSITSGSKLRFAIGLKASGRSGGTINIQNGANTSRAQVTFSLAAGTVSALTTAGSTITAISADIVQVSADFFLVMLTAVASESSVTVRLRLANDAGALTYAGDTSKGVVAWAASLAVVP